MSDLISRQSAIDAICSECSGRCIPCESYPCGEVEVLKRLQSAEPERKKGKWLPDNNNYITPHFLCSACKASQKVETIMFKPIWAFCPRCGARMGGVMKDEAD